MSAARELGAANVVFATRRRVTFGDCDATGIVFFPNYFVMLNSVVETWWEAIGHSWTELMEQRRIGIPTIQLDTQFLHPSRMGETLTFELGVVRLGNSSLTLEHRALGADVERIRIHQTLVATSLDTHRSIAWPADIRASITSLLESI